MRLIALSLTCCFLGLLVGCSKPQPNGLRSVSSLEDASGQEDAANEKLSEQAGRNAAKLKSLITKEIESLGNHAWAGSYYMGDGLGENVSLVISPTNGYVFEWHGCMGLYDRNFGKIKRQNDRLQLSFTFPNNQQGFQGIAGEFTPVSWANRTYLIPSNDLVGFCNDINSGAEPRKQVHGNYLLRDGDESSLVTGHPEIPVKFKPYLLDQPIEAAIIEIGDVTTRPSVCDWNFKDTEVIIDSGTNAGVLQGMELYVVAPNDVVESVIIRSVENNKSIGVMTQIDDDETAIKAGWKLSTRPRWND
ncbi:hypothetical protein [Rubripirellula reticaptiva]|uniref:Uncharacterized protein n=1 Tax=Rubripirellula reticaptiva TaxID=2528013 RepID=A0A5C6EST5_9BACT|nr:hypothetical protein [Rubripirellula reticaptiva]TWU51424.1 hypothetical protein Poly59_30160 [Rubripirellula reticaptiva]